MAKTSPPRFRRGLVLAVLIFLWYAVVVTADTLVRSRFDLNDYSQGSHMGSVPLQFEYGLLLTIALVAPPAIAAITNGIRYGYMSAVIGSMVVAALWNTVFFYGSGHAFCTPGVDLRGDVPSFVGFLAALALIPLASRAWLAVRARPTQHSNASIAFAVSAIATVLTFVQGYHCSGPSGQTERHFGMDLLPVLACYCLCRSAVRGPARTPRGSRTRSQCIRSVWLLRPR